MAFLVMTLDVAEVLGISVWVQGTEVLTHSYPTDLGWEMTPNTTYISSITALLCCFLRNCLVCCDETVSEMHRGENETARLGRERGL